MGYTGDFQILNWSYILLHPENKPYLVIMHNSFCVLLNFTFNIFLRIFESYSLGIIVCNLQEHTFFLYSLYLISVLEWYFSITSKILASLHWEMFCPLQSSGKKNGNDHVGLYRNFQCNHLLGSYFLFFFFLFCFKLWFLTKTNLLQNCILFSHKFLNIIILYKMNFSTGNFE